MATVPNAPAPLTQERMVDDDGARSNCCLLIAQLAKRRVYACMRGRGCSSEAPLKTFMARSAALHEAVHRLAGRFGLPSPACGGYLERASKLISSGPAPAAAGR
jgi:hypothetical protein